MCDSALLNVSSHESAISIASRLFKVAAFGVVSVVVARAKGRRMYM